MNPRPSAPKADALPGCATLRFIADVERVYPNTAIRFNHECVCASNRVKSVAGGAASWRDVNRKISRMSPRSWIPRECRRRAGSPGNAGLRTRRADKCKCGASRSQHGCRVAVAVCSRNPRENLPPPRLRSCEKTRLACTCTNTCTSTVFHFLLHVRLHPDLLPVDSFTAYAPPAGRTQRDQRTTTTVPAPRTTTEPPPTLSTT